MSQPPREFDRLIRVTLALFAIGLGVWVLLAGHAYRQEYSGMGWTWHRGDKNFIEITLVPADQTNLACASDKVAEGGLHCAFGADKKPRPDANTPGTTLSPYCTLSGDMFLGANLWESIAKSGTPMPTTRFTVLCDFDIVGGLHSAALRWKPDGPFEAAQKTLPVGTLHDCTIPP
ncbi:MAG TPA: hypothetical protein VHJ20_02275 [Polyangia bacterium]|nr:hypothetical protein [Polyangia bacterium]